MAKKLIITAPPTHPDGLLLGETAADKVALFGAAPVVQPVGATQAAIGAALVVIAGGEAPTEAEHNAVLARVNELAVLVNKLRTDLIALGAIKGAA